MAAKKLAPRKRLKASVGKSVLPVSLYSQQDVKRFLPESGEKTRDATYRAPWRRDYARLIHSPSFRRLQGKSQLFPCPESDFFRNRLTHSLEVAQIAKAIAEKANASNALGQHKLDLDLVSFAGLSHDLGHPPFGHNGEEALHLCMAGYGGFEGNAQTLRILTTLEKKRYVEQLKPRNDVANNDHRRGLNLTYRSLAAILKYDNQLQIGDRKFGKGYYASEAAVVKQIKSHVAPGINIPEGKFKTIECQIMDIADDIAYSTYDLEDSFKAGFLTPLDILASLMKEGFREKVVKGIEEAMQKALKDKRFKISESAIYLILESLLEVKTEGEHPVVVAALSRNLAEDGHLRTEFTANLVHQFVEGVQFELNEKCPALSRAKLDPTVLLKVETLKRYTFMATILSPRLQIANFRGQEIVEGIFNTLSSDGGHRLLPEDVQSIYENCRANEAKERRTICDFVAGMTDRYAVEFYERIKSANGLTIFKPH